MNNENTNEIKKGNVLLYNRSKVELTGIIKIINLNSEKYVLDTNLGTLIITGNNLEMQQLELEKGVLNISGNINSISYDHELKEKNKQSIFSKLFK